MLNFPNTPTVGQKHQAYIWDGEKWSTSPVLTFAGGSDASPVMDGAASAGSSTKYSRSDHVHPSDTSRAPINNATFTGVMTAAMINVSGNVTVNGRLISTAKGHKFGTAGGTAAAGAVTKADANIKLYDHTVEGSPDSWCGIGTDSSGHFWVRTGYSGNPAPVFYIQNDQTMVFREPPTLPTPAAGNNSTRIATTEFVKGRAGGGSYVPLSGGSVGTLTQAGADMWVHNNGNYGVIYLGNSGARYLQWDGGTYNFNGAAVFAGQGRIYGTNDWGGAMPYNNARLAYVTDRNFPYGEGMQEPYGGSTITGQTGSQAAGDWIRRFRQFQYYTNGWFAIGYA
jgi:hypothetical protein